MRLEAGEIAVFCLDADGMEISPPTVAENMKDAKRRAKLWLTSEELRSAGLHKTEIRNSKGECLVDYFA
jgi:hypothetical protein